MGTVETVGHVELSSEGLSALVDPGYGADIVDLVHVPSGTQLLFSTPWRRRAEGIRNGQANMTTQGSRAQWLERYRGGWQLLCPSAGPATNRYGAPLGFHGEASVASWSIIERSRDRVKLRTQLFTLPIEIDREIRLTYDSVKITDRLTNVSDVELEVDYVQHPAFGEEILEGSCTLDVGARAFYLDPDTYPGASRQDWPIVAVPGLGQHDLRVIPGRGSRALPFGWLSEFEEHWMELHSHSTGLTLRLEWDGTYLPHAWLWRELNTRASWPWYRRARVVALEPASIPSSGTDRRSALQLSAGASAEITVSLFVRQGRAPTKGRPE